MILVTGGAGYIGGCFVWACHDAGIPVVVLDNLSTGKKEALPVDTPLFIGEISNENLVETICQEYNVTHVVHFAGSIIVEESVENPILYYKNNTSSTIAFITSILRAGVKYFIFSSTAAVYGNTESGLVNEDAPPSPVSPYGWSKLFVEQILKDLSQSSSLRFIALRYFNVAGADSQLRTGLRTKNATHLIKVCSEVALGRRSTVTIFGTDYPTVDGTGVRDYIHVADLADAHLHALHYLSEGGESSIMNCGYGHGVSVRQVLDTYETILGHPLPNVVGPRRLGDASQVVADTHKLRSRLNWRPRYDNIETIIRSALEWEKTLLHSVENIQQDNVP